MPEWYIPQRPSRWLPSHIGRRATMTARRWEGILFTPSSLDRLCDMPCCDDLDSRLISVANDWIRTLKKLINLELQRRSHKVDGYCEPYQFSRLHAMVYQLHDRIYRYSRGVPQIRQTPKHHQTTYPGRPESDVAQARQTIAKLLQMDFGTWIEDIIMGGWLHAYPGATFTDFEFNPVTGVLDWTDHDALNDGLFPCNSLVLDMIFQDQKPTEEDLEGEDEIEPRSVFSWVLGVPDDVNFSHDGVMGGKGFVLCIDNAPDITSDMNVSIRLDFSANNTIMSSHRFDNIPVSQFTAQRTIYHESPQSTPSATDEDEETESEDDGQTESYEE
ncbi:uncharacterized protein F4807DRAFT_460367 [Annulohypoxylon truncatum]|uniref:uncharacterized protein n=1 Tax=Annulohypoxylon truncatum TaxID=327061 RepID=UPI002008EABA|nr:uncharacterized protein F4807DRAFT_460367 [Annulohypoxylon truncatum]KAI1209619.1 hypothetical protein F4807DRAFT_460367 [Annulohypoxylon truncatum]